MPMRSAWKISFKADTKTNMKKYLILHILAIGFCRGINSQIVADTTVTLQNIEIRGTYSGSLISGGVRRLQVENNLSSLTGTTAEALRQIPSVNTDIEGGVTFRGSSKSGILLNEVPFGFLAEFSGDVLIQLPAAFFNRVYLSSYPPIEWMPDGDAGILNLTSSFSKTDSPVQITAGAGLEDRYQAGALVNLHPGKFHILGRYDYRKEYRKRSFRKITTNKTGTTEMDNNASARPDIHLADLRIGYDIDPYNTVSAYGLYYLMDYSRYGGINNTKKNPAGEIVNRMLRHRFNEQRQDAYATEARWNYRKANKALQLLFNYNNFSYDEDNDFRNENPQSGAIVAQDNLFIRHEKDNYYLSALYERDFSGGIFMKAGYTFRNLKEQFHTDANNLKEEIWVPNPQKSDRYNYRLSSHMLFASLEKRWKKFAGEIGVQAEKNDRKIVNKSLNRKKSYPVHFYPRIHLSYIPNDRNIVSLKYIQRVIRPLGKELTDFVDNSDATHVFQGNPGLKNETIHSLELSYSLILPKLRITPALYYRTKDNRIMEIATMEEEGMIWRKENVGNSQLWGLEATASWNPLPYLSLSASGNLFIDEIDGQQAGYGEKKSMTCWDIKGAINVYITRNTEIQIDGFHVSDQLTPQGKIKNRAALNAGISQYLMNRKLRLNASINNILDSLEETTVIDSDDLYMKQIRNRDSRVTWLTATFML